MYLNHELRDAQGIVRRHGATGAFVSRWVIDRKTLEVKAGSDLIDPGVSYWDYPERDVRDRRSALSPIWQCRTPTFGRFCSATLSDPGVFYDARSGKGYRGQIYFANEEDGDNGRAFAVTTDGQATAFPRIGLFSWENTVPAHNRSKTTLVMGDEDGPGDGSQLRAYVGIKQGSGDPLARAGLDQRPELRDRCRELGGHGRCGLAGDIRQGRLRAGPPRERALEPHRSPSELARQDRWPQPQPDRGWDWDPRHPNDFYFVTTEGGQTSGTGLDARDGGGLWRLRFDDIDRPFAGATLTLLLDGSESLGGTEPKFNKPDNLGIDRHGNLLIQEDPGGNNHVARIIAYRLKDGALGVVARFDEARFGPAASGSPAFLTIDEESSGIVDGEAAFGKGTFLFDAQVHTATGLPAGTGPGTVQEFVERGQLLLLKVRDWDEVYGD